MQANCQYPCLINPTPGVWHQGEVAAVAAAYLMSTILMTEALPMRCSATMESPLEQ